MLLSAGVNSARDRYVINSLSVRPVINKPIETTAHVDLATSIRDVTGEVRGSAVIIVITRPLPAGRRTTARGCSRVSPARRCSVLLF